MMHNLTIEIRTDNMDGTDLYKMSNPKILRITARLDSYGTYTLTETENGELVGKETEYKTDDILQAFDYMKRKFVERKPSGVK